MTCDIIASGPIAWKSSFNTRWLSSSFSLIIRFFIFVTDNFKDASLLLSQTGSSTLFSSSWFKFRFFKSWCHRLTVSVILNRLFICWLLIILLGRQRINYVIIYGFFRRRNQLVMSL